MLSWPGSVRIYVATQPTSMRRSFDGLSNLVREILRKDPLSGHLFVFFNRRGDQYRGLWWDRDGFTVCGKRLEKGRFRLPWKEASSTVHELEASELSLILGGIDLRGARRRPRWNSTLTIDQSSVVFDDAR